MSHKVQVWRLIVVVVLHPPEVLVAGLSRKTIAKWDRQFESLSLQR
jgi:hypothetical protein